MADGNGAVIRRRFLAILICAIACQFSCAGNIETRSDQGRLRLQLQPGWDRIFVDAGASPGCAAFFDTSTQILELNDLRRCRTERLPASTFKIFLALVAFESGAARDVTFAQRWDGQRYDIDAWNRDHTIQSAFTVSAVWFFEGLARRIGEATLRDSLRRYSYGNQAFSGQWPPWIQGELRISALEQIEFLRKIQSGSIEASPRSVQLLRTIMRSEKREGRTLFTKTGLSTQPAGAAWQVGWIEDRSGQAKLFAINYGPIDGELAALVEQRKRIVTELLAAGAAW